MILCKFFINKLKSFTYYGIRNLTTLRFADFYFKEEKMTIAYIDKNSLFISKLEQKKLLLSFLNVKKITDVNFIENENIFADISFFSKYKRLIIPSLLLLGKDLDEVQRHLSILSQYEMELISLKENLIFSTKDEIKNFIKEFEMILQMKKAYSSVKIKKALQQKKERGLKIGRSFGAKNKKKTKCEENHDYIINALKKGENMLTIANAIGVSIRTLFNYKKIILSGK